MLVLTRKVDETILIGDDVSITVLSIDGERARLGIDAPRSLRIFRSELIKETKNLNKAAVTAPLVMFEMKKNNAVQSVNAVQGEKNEKGEVANVENGEKSEKAENIEIGNAEKSEKAETGDVEKGE